MTKKIILTLLGVIFLAVVYWLASPLFINSVVNETLPVSHMESTPLSGSTLKSSSGAVVKSSVELNNAPSLLFEGNFKDTDSFHKGSGHAKIFVMQDSTKTLRLEDFSVTNGPDLFVYITNDNNLQDGLDSFTSIAPLKGNKGNQNYSLPEDLSITNETKVLIWCRAFGVLFSEAQLKTS